MSNARTVAPTQMSATALKRKRMRVAISPNAKYAKQTVSIQIDLIRNDNEPITLTIRSSSCARPYYVVRLTGPAVVAARQQHHYDFNGDPFPPSIIKYRHDVGQLQYLYNRPNAASSSTSQRRSNSSRTPSHDATTTKIEMYPIPVAGNYSLEILHLTCNSSYATAKTDCLPRTHKDITLNKYPIHLQLPQQQQRQDNDFGYWASNHQPSSPPPPIVQTRMQVEKTCDDEPCSHNWFTQHYDSYKNEPPYDYPKTHADVCRTICFLGASHSRWLLRSFREILAPMQDTHRAKHVLLKYPTDYNGTHTHTITKHACTDVVVGVAQWTLSQMKDRLDSPDAFAAQLGSIADDIHEIDPSIRMYFRSVHHNTLKRNALKCKPADSRVPHFSEGYTEAMRGLMETHPILSNQTLGHAFLYTNPIVLPIWDTWEDFSHVKGLPALVEARYMLQHMKVNTTDQPKAPCPFHVRELRRSDFVARVSMSQTIITGLGCCFVAIVWRHKKQREKSAVLPKRYA